jgi:Ran GTPase-activating protein (RanGAP) involved in mRNA processing and transport
LNEHRKLESLEIKSNDISAEGFKELFQALKRNPNLRQLVLEYNNLGEGEYEDWETSLCELIESSLKLERLNISNNKISSESFKRIVPSLARSKSLKMLEFRYNRIDSSDIDYLVGELKR